LSLESTVKICSGLILFNKHLLILTGLWNWNILERQWGRIYFGGPRKSDIVIINVRDLSFRYHADMTTKGLGWGLAN